VLSYGPEACPLNTAAVNSLDFVINRFFMKLSKINNADTVRKKLLLEFVIPTGRNEHFSIKYKACDDGFFLNPCNRCSLLEFEIVWSSISRYVLLPLLPFFLYFLSVLFLISSTVIRELKIIIARPKIHHMPYPRMLCAT